MDLHKALNLRKFKIEKQDAVKPAGLPPLWGSMYAHPNTDGSRKNCKNCIMWSQDKRCSIHPEDLEILSTAVCGYHIFGNPMDKRMDHPGMKTVDPKFSGLENIPGGTTCDVCFPVGTPVLMADGIERPIEMIKVGDEVVGYNGVSTCKTVVKNVGGRIAEKDDLRRITFWKGHKFILMTTKEHPFFVVGKGYVKADDLCSQDDIFYLSLSEWAKWRMDNGNPMKNKGIAKKVADLTRDRRRKGGDLYYKVHTEKGREARRNRMIKDNPARLPHVRELARRRALDPNCPMRTPDAIRKQLKSMRNRPTGLEKRFMRDVVDVYDLPLKYIGDGSLILGRGGKIKIPDFEVNGQKKVVEVYDSRWPEREVGWKEEKESFYNDVGYKSLFLSVDTMTDADKAGAVTEFVNNGAEVVRVTRAGSRYSNPKSWPDKLEVFNIQTETENYFVHKLLVHNCSHFIPKDDESGHCRANVSSHKGIFPAPVEALGCCGRFEKL